MFLIFLRGKARNFGTKLCNFVDRDNNLSLKPKRFKISLLNDFNSSVSWVIINIFFFLAANRICSNGEVVLDAFVLALRSTFVQGLAMTGWTNT